MPNLHELRVQKGLSQRQVAIAIGVGQAMLSHLEQRKKRPSTELAIKLADYFNVSVDVILDRHPIPTEATPCQN